MSGEKKITYLDYFPEKFPRDAYIFRTDSNILYKNVSTFDTPKWIELTHDNEPTGIIKMYASIAKSIPVGYLLCDGSAVKIKSYPALYSEIGTKFGTPTETGTFLLPDLTTNNRFPRSISDDSEINETGGESMHTLTKAELPAHNHGGLNPRSHTHSMRSTYRGASRQITSRTGSIPSEVQNSSNIIITTYEVGGSEAHENRPPFETVYFIIKT